MQLHCGKCGRKRHGSGAAIAGAKGYAIFECIPHHHRTLYKEQKHRGKISWVPAIASEADVRRLRRQAAEEQAAIDAARLSDIERGLAERGLVIPAAAKRLG